ncbi:hypothetical protein EKD16_01780 [Streptomonospora litoralis]|uniref:Uncharacterized protein n=1 Tax=Streptomonospora litoralis TaxID=2498135 RepID=A0A4P6PVR2_9ACTN|nr:hypothetical protein EKD16_01780 [Streptomonospora litoralis]
MGCHGEGRARAQRAGCSPVAATDEGSGGSNGAGPAVVGGGHPPAGGRSPGAAARSSARGSRRPSWPERGHESHVRAAPSASAPPRGATLASEFRNTKRLGVFRPLMPELSAGSPPRRGGDGPRSAPNGAKTAPTSTFRASRDHGARRGRPQNGHRPPIAHPIGRWSSRRPRPGVTSDVSSPPDPRSGGGPGPRERPRPRHTPRPPGGAGPVGTRRRRLPAPRARYVRRAGFGRGGRGDRGRIPKKRRRISSYGHDRRAALRHNEPASASRLPPRPRRPRRGGHRRTPDPMGAGPATLRPRRRFSVRRPAFRQTNKAAQQTRSAPPQPPPASTLPVGRGRHSAASSPPTPAAATGEHPARWARSPALHRPRRPSSAAASVPPRPPNTTDAGAGGGPARTGVRRLRTRPLPGGCGRAVRYPTAAGLRRRPGGRPPCRSRRSRRTRR